MAAKRGSRTLVPGTIMIDRGSDGARENDEKSFPRAQYEATRRRIGPLSRSTLSLDVAVSKSRFGQRCHRDCHQGLMLYDAPCATRCY